MRGRGILATYRKRWEHYPIKQLCSAVFGYKPTSVVAKNNSPTRRSWHDLNKTHTTPPLWKNNPPEQGEKAPLGPYGRGPYKELGMQHAAGDGTTPTLPSTEVSAVPHGLALGRGAFRRCAVFLSRAAEERGRPDTFGVLQRACYVIMWSNRKVLMTERGEVGGFFLLWWLSAH